MNCSRRGIPNLINSSEFFHDSMEKPIASAWSGRTMAGIIKKNVHAGIPSGRHMI